MSETTNNTATTTQGQPNTTETETPKTYTAEEVEALLQKETDRRVTSALKKAEQKNADKLREAEKLAKMSAEEKFQYELEQREKAIVEKEKELALAENRNAASQILAEKGISLKLVDFVIADDADVMNSRIKLLDAEFKKSVKAEVEKRLGSATPQANLMNAGEITKAAFAKMSLSEKQRLFNNDRELYDSLTSK